MRARSRELTVLAFLALAVVFVDSCWDPDEADVPAPRHPPVVMIVFDELSTTSLLDHQGTVDATRYPSFASLAGDATWFPYATASLDETGRALRSLLTARTTWRFAKPTYRNNPRNVFTLFGRRYRVDATEEVTSLCPNQLCPHSRPSTKRSVLHKLSTGRPERFERWVRSLGPHSHPTFYFGHALLPHAPWRYLPSGHHFVDGPTQRRFSWNAEHFNRWLVNQNYQRHLLQVGFTDRMLGQALERLRTTGLYDRSLIVVTADNGEGFGRLGNGHEISQRNAGDIALTPLFVKLPYQQEGNVMRRHVRMIDVVPTMARIAHLRLGWRLEGRPVFGPAARRIPDSTLLVQRSGLRIHLTSRALRGRASRALRLKARLFGSSAASGLFAIGPYRFMHGTPVGRWLRLGRGHARAILDPPGRMRSVRPGSNLVPVRVLGRLSGSPKDTNLAIAVNGTIEATAPTIRVHRGRVFSVLIPESSLHAGTNRVEVFGIVRAPGGPRLRPLTG
jgi:Sulfatase